MEQKTKIQHYVPQFYLNAWGITQKHQIYVYNKISDSKRINNIKDIASERYFYDINLIFPISPDLVLIMIDGAYHTQFLPFERRYIEITDNSVVDKYNSILSMQSKRLVFSADGNFTLIDKMKKRNPNIFKQPQIQMNWGGKTYYRQTNEVALCLNKLQL